MKLHFHHLLAIVCLPALAIQTSCTSSQQQGAVIGGLAGAAFGAATGNDSDVVLLGAALGAGAGAGAAAMGENAARRNAYRPTSNAPYPPRYHNRRPSAPAPAPAPRQPEYPLARRTSKPGQVISPFSPYNVIDVTGFKSGALARDPSNKKIFRVP